MTLAPPPWYLAPYVVGLGFADWIQQHTPRSDRAVISELGLQAQRHRRSAVRAVIGLALLLVLLVGVVEFVLGPVVTAVGSRVSTEAAVLTGMAVALLSALAFTALVLRSGYRTLLYFYIRGLLVLEERAHRVNLNR